MTNPTLLGYVKSGRLNGTVVIDDRAEAERLVTLALKSWRRKLLEKATSSKELDSTWPGVDAAVRRTFGLTRLDEILQELDRCLNTARAVPDGARFDAVISRKDEAGLLLAIEMLDAELTAVCPPEPEEEQVVVVEKGRAIGMTSVSDELARKAFFGEVTAPSSAMKPGAWVRSSKSKKRDRRG